MSLLEKLDELKLKYQSMQSILLKEERLVDLFGENFMENTIQLQKGTFCYVFEENKTLYYVVIDDHSKPIYLMLLDPYENTAYSKVTIPFVRNLYRRKDNYELILIADSYEEEVRKIDVVLNHPLIRLKFLFAKETN